MKPATLRAPHEKWGNSQYWLRSVGRVLRAERLPRCAELENIHRSPEQPFACLVRQEQRRARPECRRASFDDAELGGFFI